MANEIITQQRFDLRPKSFDEAMRFAELIAESEFCPSAFRRKAGDVLCAMQFANEIGLSPMQGLQNIAVINGKPSIYGDAALAIVRSHPAFVSIDEREPNEALAKGEALCTITVQAKDGTRSITRRFTTADAKAAGLLGKQGPWSQYPGRMMQMRARSWAMRDALPEALKGMSVAEESMDIIETTVRTLPTTTAPSLPAPEQSIDVPIEPTVAPLKVDDFADRFSECSTAEQVKSIANEIRALKVDDATRATLAKAYSAAMARVSK